MRNYMHLASVMLLTMALAACAQIDPQLKVAMAHRTITSVEVEFTPEVQRGLLPSLTTLNDEQKVQMVRERVRTALAGRIVSLPQGREPTILVVTINNIVIPDGFARTVGGISTLGGTARLVDQRSRSAVGSDLVPVQVQDGGFAGNGIIGMLTVAAVNAVVNATQDKLNSLSEAFATMLMGQLNYIAG